MLLRTGLGLVRAERFLMFGFPLNIHHFLDRCNPDVIYSTDIIQGFGTAEKSHGYFMRIFDILPHFTYRGFKNVIRIEYAARLILQA
jgi:hypothetical protein